MEAEAGVRGRITSPGRMCSGPGRGEGSSRLSLVLRQASAPHLERPPACGRPLCGHAGCWRENVPGSCNTFWNFLPERRALVSSEAEKGAESESPERPISRAPVKSCQGLGIIGTFSYLTWRSLVAQPHRKGAVPVPVTVSSEPRLLPPLPSQAAASHHLRNANAPGPQQPGQQGLVGMCTGNPHLPAHPEPPGRSDPHGIRDPAVLRLVGPAAVSGVKPCLHPQTRRHPQVSLPPLPATCPSTHPRTQGKCFFYSALDNHLREVRVGTRCLHPTTKRVAIVQSTCYS